MTYIFYLAMILDETSLVSPYEKEVDANFTHRHNRSSTMAERPHKGQFGNEEEKRRDL
ncbi:hypothetical protein HCR_23200 (plasmid) [Hydrogenimonas cancrithermarum]|uniref:Uncharacterized protein n=1 Tax=Hydrogenimonas cancrithermarum TaxID=2993563 RepID=A0ABM8FNQ1_9BACT|nr:hypothetical protein HCR_23200 [Hydrogenimonas cancrithermarum]